MKLFDIEINSLLPYAVYAFCEVYGKEYYDIIYEKIYKAIIILYYDEVGMESYLYYLESCKKREYIIKFLNQIGIETDKYLVSDNYSHNLPDEITDILSYYLDKYFVFTEYTDTSSPIRAFSKNQKFESKKELIRARLKIINYLLKEGHEEINEDNYNNFIQTSEYYELLKKINKYNNIYDNLLSEYNNWLKGLLSYQKYQQKEKTRKCEILKKKKEELFLEIFPKLPLIIQNQLVNKSLDEQIKIILGTLTIDTETIIETFTEELGWYKSYVQLNFLKNMGLDVPKEIIDECNDGNYDAYLTFLNQKNVREFLPSPKFTKYVTDLRNKKYEEGLYEYYMSSEYIIEILKQINISKDSLKELYKLLKNESVCVLGDGGRNAYQEFISVMLYTVRPNDKGSLAFSFLHEIGHIIDQNAWGNGLETPKIVQYMRNPYDNRFRKYEKITEALNDIFTLEAIKILYQKDIYLIEPKEVVSLDINNFNTGILTKKVLTPLVRKFRKEVISAKINANPRELINCLGYENFEELVDIVNKVDYLERNGLQQKMESSTEDAMISEYYEQVDRTNKIYMNIDKYYEDKFINQEKEIKVKKRLKSYN